MKGISLDLEAMGPFGYRPLSGKQFHGFCQGLGWQKRVVAPGPGAQFYPHPPSLPREGLSSFQRIEVSKATRETWSLRRLLPQHVCFSNGSA